MRSEQEIMSEVIAVVGKHAKNQAALQSATRTTHIAKDLEVNSARFVDIILDFEDKFNLEINDEDADKIGTIGDACDLVGRLLN
jgi:acyl carrier protein